MFVRLFYYNELMNASKAVRSFKDNCLYLFFAFSASPPCHKMASSTFRARPSCNKFVCSLTVLINPIPHSGCVLHSLPFARKSGALSAKSDPMSCKSKSVYGRMVWFRIAAMGCVFPVWIFGLWQPTQFSVSKIFFPSKTCLSV